MKYASLTKRIKPADNAEGDPWEVHEIACRRAAAGENIVLLSIGQEADEHTPTTIVNAAIQSLQNGDHHYADVNGTPELRASIARYHTSLTGQKVEPDNCTSFAGAQNALFATAQVLLEAGDEVIVSEPYYTTYAATFSSSGAYLVSIPVTKANDFQLNTDDISNAITDKTQAIVLNSPNNPMGTCYNKKEFATVVALCIKHNIWLIVDAVYLDIVSISPTDLPHTIPGAEDVLVTIGSLSKSHRMTGWRIGWTVAPTKVASHLRHLSMCMHYGLPPFIMKAASVAIEQSHQTPKLVRDTLARRRQMATPILAAIRGATLHDTGQGMFMLIDVSELGISAYKFSMRLLKEYNVAVLPCDGFGHAGTTLVRVGLCVDDAKLEGACRKIVECVAAYRDTV